MRADVNVIITTPEGTKLVWVHAPSTADVHNKFFELYLHDLGDLLPLPQGQWARGVEFVTWAKGPWIGKALKDPVVLSWRVNRVDGSAPTAICRAWPDKLVIPVVGENVQINIVGLHMLHRVIELKAS
jgi:hypothetical protein